MELEDQSYAYILSKKMTLDFGNEKPILCGNRKSEKWKTLIKLGVNRVQLEVPTDTEQEQHEVHIT